METPERSPQAPRLIGPGLWLRAGLFGIAAAFVIAIPTRLVPNGFFRRMTPTRPFDYVLLLAGSALIGLTLALRTGTGRAGSTAVAGGVGTTLAVGCPVCNKLVVALLGTGGALDVFAPLQPVIGLASVGVLAFGLRGQLRWRSAAACPVVPGSKVADRGQAATS